MFLHLPPKNYLATVTNRKPRWSLQILPVFRSRPIHGTAIGQAAEMAMHVMGVKNNRLGMDSLINALPGEAMY